MPLVPSNSKIRRLSSMATRRQAATAALLALLNSAAADAAKLRPELRPVQRPS